MLVSVYKDYLNTPLEHILICRPNVVAFTFPSHKNPPPLRKNGLSPEKMGWIRLPPGNESDPWGKVQSEPVLQG